MLRALAILGAAALAPAVQLQDVASRLRAAEGQACADDDEAVRRVAAEGGDKITGCAEAVGRGACSDPDTAAIMAKLCCSSCSPQSNTQRQAQPSAATTQSTSARTESNHSSGQTCADDDEAVRRVAAEGGDKITGCAEAVGRGACSDPDTAAIMAKLCCSSCSPQSNTQRQAQPSAATTQSTSARTESNHSSGQTCADDDEAVRRVAAEGGDKITGCAEAVGRGACSDPDTAAMMAKLCCSSCLLSHAPASRQNTGTRAEEQTSGKPSMPSATSQNADNHTARSGGGDQICNDDSSAVAKFATQHNATSITGCREMVGHCHDTFVRRICCATCSKVVCEDDHSAITDLARAHNLHSIDGCSAVSDSCDDPYVRHVCCSTCARASKVSRDVEDTIDPAATLDIISIGATNVKKEHFDLNRRGEHLLLRVPSDPELPASLQVQGHVSVDIGLTCRTYISDVTLSGTWLGKQMVSFRPMRKNKFNKDQPYPFAARVFSSEDMSGPWRTPEAFPQKEEVSGLVTIGLTRSKDEENGGANETFLLTVGPEPNTAAILVSQGAHGLHAELHRLDQLGEKHLGGLLGTEDRSNTEEEPVKECVAMQANRTRLMMEEEWLARPRVLATWS